MQKIYKKSIHPYELTLPQSNLEGLKEVCSRKKYTWMAAEIIVFLYIRSLNCELFPIPEAFIPGHGSMAIKKNSPYKEVIKIT